MLTYADVCCIHAGAGDAGDKAEEAAGRQERMLTYADVCCIHTGAGDAGDQAEEAAGRQEREAAGDEGACFTSTKVLALLVLKYLLLAYKNEKQQAMKVLALRVLKYLLC